MTTVREKLSIKPTTTNIDGYLHIQIYNGTLGKYEDYRIHSNDFLAAVNSRLASIPIRVQYINKSANFTHALAAKQSVERIDFSLVSGSCTVKVGTTSGGSDIVSNRTLETGSEDKTITLGKYFPTATTLYITITGTAIINANVWYINELING